MAVTIKAMFIGHNGSMDFIKGEIYTLTIHENRVVSPKHVPYGSTEAFLKNWLPMSEHHVLALTAWATKNLPQPGRPTLDLLDNGEQKTL